MNPAHIPGLMPMMMPQTIGGQQVMMVARLPGGGAGIPQPGQALVGHPGMQGIHGMQGMQGIPGMQGMQGIPGMQGMQGLQGLQV